MVALEQSDSVGGSEPSSAGVTFAIFFSWPGESLEPAQFQGEEA